jgi:hypothetical protein
VNQVCDDDDDDDYFNLTTEGVWGFINHLDSREVGQLLAQSIATEARQQQIFRQMSGLSPVSLRHISMK